MDLHTLTKVRRANKSADGVEGIVYIHQWPDGFKEVVFTTEQVADGFLKAVNAAGQPKVQEVEDGAAQAS